MKILFLHQAHNDTLVLFFAGFGSHPTHFQHLTATRVDVALVYDYRIFEPNIALDLDTKSYSCIILMGFSMGVFIASVCKDLESFAPRITQKIAINGTNFPIHKEFGINPILFKRTIKKLNLEDFKRQLFGQNLSLAKDFVFLSEEELRAELENLFTQNLSAQNEHFLWHKALLSKQDLIFPCTSCASFFKGRSEIFYQNLPHFVFFDFVSWESLCAI